MLAIKKIMAGVLVAAMAVSITACSNSKSANKVQQAKAASTATTTTAQTNSQNDNQSTENQSTYSGISTEEAKDILSYHCAVLSGFDDDSYGVEYSYDTVYKGVWYNADEVGATDPDYLVPEDEVTDDIFTDDSSFYYQVTSVSSDQEARNDLLNYMSEDVLNQLYGIPLYDYGDTTYLKREYKGYAPIDRDYSNATISNVTDTSFTATMDCYMFSVENYVGTCTLDMSKSGDSWYIVGYSQNF